MAREKRAPGETLPLAQATVRIKQRAIVYVRRGVVIAQKWQRGRGRPPTQAEIDQQNEFRGLVIAIKNVIPSDAVAAREIADGSKNTWRDILSRVMIGRLVDNPNYGAIVSQYNLDILGTEPGSLVTRTVEEWVALIIGEDGQVLTVVDGLASWADAPPVTLTGDVTGGPSSGTIATTLAASGATAGSYDLATVTVNAKGLVTAVSAGSAAGTNTIAHPGFITGRYYGKQVGELLSTTAAAANRMYATPFYVPFTTTFTKMACRTGPGGAGNIELGVYANANGAPAALVHDCGSIASGSANTTYEITGRTILLNPGWYWLTVATSGTPTLVTTPASDAIGMNLFGQSSALNETRSLSGYIGTWTYSAGNLPNPFPSPTILVTACPMAFIGI